MQVRAPRNDEFRPQAFSSLDQYDVELCTHAPSRWLVGLLSPLFAAPVLTLPIEDPFLN
jgi:hypothetical protein